MEHTSKSEFLNTPVADMILSQDKPTAFLLKSRMKQIFPVSSLLFDTVLKDLPIVIRKENLI